MNILFVNTRKAACSIHQFGVMAYKALSNSQFLNVNYVEIQDLDRLALYRGDIIKNGVLDLTLYDAFIFNYHDVMRDHEGVQSQLLYNLRGLKIAIILEMQENDPLARSYFGDGSFDLFMVIDPTMKYDDKKFVPFPRPLLETNLPEYIDKDIPVIGSYGFGFDRTKGFERILYAVNKEFDECVVRFNIPYATYMPYNNQELLHFKKECLQIVKPGIKLEITHTFMEEEELISWCAQNTLNAFFYDRPYSGLSSAVDHALICSRPISVSSNRNAFRHIHEYQPFYPNWSLKENIELGKYTVDKMRDDWCFSSFQQTFIKMIMDNKNV